MWFSECYFVFLLFLLYLSIGKLLKEVSPATPFIKLLISMDVGSQILNFTTNKGDNTTYLARVLPED